MGLLVGLMGEIRAISGARESSAASPDGPANDAEGRRDSEARYLECSFFAALSFLFRVFYYYFKLCCAPEMRPGDKAEKVMCLKKGREEELGGKIQGFLGAFFMETLRLCVF